MNIKDMIFKDRLEAGERLSKFLKKYSTINTVIYALPRGGVIVGAKVAKILKAPLDIIVVKKIGHPYNPELAIGAVAEEGVMVLSEIGRNNLGEEWFQNLISKKRREIEADKERYSAVKMPMSPLGKIAIIVDDGIATGLTMLAAIKWLKSKKAAKVIAAAPVAPKEIISKLESEDCDLVVAEIPEDFIGAVGNYYEKFNQISDEEVEEALRDV